MDARARLQRYLEQRREVGESELVLDSMSVEDVMALVGMKPGQHASAKSTRVTKAPPKPTGESDRVSQAPELPDAPLPAEPVAPVAPVAPAARFDTTANTAWREVLSEGTPQASRSSDVPSRAPRNVVVPSWLGEIGWAGGIAFTSGSALGTAHTGTNGIDAELTALKNLDTIAEHIRGCQRCGLHSGARHAVPGEGDPHAELVCVGEGPDAAEDEVGRPFVGESGQLLTKILSAISLPREAVYICNVVKHRPPGNRDPLPEEVVACQPYLRRQLAVVAPRVILALGRFAAQALLETSEPLGKLRGKIHTYNGIPVVATYHPAALLRNAAWKRPAWEDVKMARRILDLSRSANGDTTAGHHGD